MDICKVLGISEKTYELSKKAEEISAKEFKRIEEIAFKGQLKVQKAFENARISAAHFTATSGYGYDDEGREALDKVYAEVFGAEAALVRANIISGTHALSTMLFALLRPGDKLLAATGKPYDTLEGVIKGGKSSLESFGVNYGEVSLTENGTPDYDGIKAALSDKSIKVVMLQRSKGYAIRPSLTISDIEKLCAFIKAHRSDVIIAVDNCYGEFVEEKEPVAVGADIMAGSLIKNPGGGLAPTGGYIAGKAELIELAADALTAPGIGLECGCNFGMIKSLFQGFYMAPHIVSQSIKTATFCGNLMALMGYEVSPSSGEPRSDIIEAICLGSAEKVIAFCEGIQALSPVDSFVTPVPWAMPGYTSEVIMAAGAFNQGSSIEISADAPIREPFAVYMQGGLTYESGKLAVMKAADNVLKIS